MKAFILAAGKGTRLKPWTDSHPKALVPVKGVPMLGRVISSLYAEGIRDFTVNIHHFGSQIREYLDNPANLPPDVQVKISDESDELLETGGALLKASPLLCREEESILVHNVDILSNADFGNLQKAHTENCASATLLISDRETSRKLIFDKDWRLRGWHNSATGEYRPEGFMPGEGMHEMAFSGIYIISPSLIRSMEERGWQGRFSIIDFLLSAAGAEKIMGYISSGLQLLDIGKPDSLSRADRFLDKLKC